MILDEISEKKFNHNFLMKKLYALSCQLLSHKDALSCCCRKASVIGGIYQWGHVGEGGMLVQVNKGHISAWEVHGTSVRVIVWLGW